MNTFFRNLLSLNLLCITLFFTACSKDDDGTNNIDNLATGPIELPVLRQGVNDLFISYSTKFNGQDVTTYSMEYDKSKKHARWVAFKYYNVTGQTNWNRNYWETLGRLIRIFFSLINEYKVTLESKAMIVGIFVLLQIVFIQKMPMSKLSIIAI